jgi:hypothetical protein
MSPAEANMVYVVKKASLNFTAPPTSKAELNFLGDMVDLKINSPTGGSGDQPLYEIVQCCLSQRRARGPSEFAQKGPTWRNRLMGIIAGDEFQSRCRPMAHASPLADNMNVDLVSINDIKGSCAGINIPPVGSHWMEQDQSRRHSVNHSVMVSWELYHGASTCLDFSFWNFFLKPVVPKLERSHSVGFICLGGVWKPAWLIPT